jgi:uncharacterized metal-binding protein
LYLLQVFAGVTFRNGAVKAAALLVLSLLAFLVRVGVNAVVAIDPTKKMLSAATQKRAWLEAHPVVIGYAVAGFILGGAAHSLADIVWSWIKRKTGRAFRTR